MADDIRKLFGSRGTHGSTVTRVLLIILGSILALCGVILGIATIGIMLDGDASILILLPFTISACVGGIYIIISQANAGKEEAKALREADDQLDDGERVVSSIPLGRTQAQEPAPSEPANDTAATSATEDVAHLVYRSDDLFATLRDLVRHSTKASERDKRHLASMLEAAGVMGWPDAPACEGGRLTRNNHFWIRMGVDSLSDEQYDTLIAAEAALSVNQDLPGVRTKELDAPEAREAALRLMRGMSEQKIERPKLTDDGLRLCYRSTDASATKQDWVVRSMVCNAAECARTPFRVYFDLRVNIDDGLVLLNLEAPRPRCFAIFSPDAPTQAGLARAYAFRLAVLLASHAFAASDKVRRVVVNCHEHQRDEVLASLDIDRTVLPSLAKVATGSAVESGFPADERIRAQFANGWFAPVEPFLALDDPQLVPQAARVFPELDQRIASPEVQRTCHVQRICDLGINENAARVAAWNDVRERLGATTEQAVSTLMAARNAATDITVAEACNRVAQALVNGEVELEDLRSLAELFVDGSALDRALARAVDLLDDSEDHEDPEAALKVLETALAPIEDMGAYLDDDTCVYRYFGSVSERIDHNATVDEGGREVRLVPDSYFNAHSNASIALGMLGRSDEALAHADVCLRLAPTSTYATMRKVRVLEGESRVYEAADLIIEALRHAVTPRDAAICHYRLAYMEWKLGREDLAAACYVRSMTWDTEMTSQAREELDDLLSSIPSLERPTAEQADALLAREGIPLGCVRTDGEHTLAAAVACMDDGALLSARPLMAALFGMNNDDVVMGVYRSLNTGV